MAKPQHVKYRQTTFQ